MSEHSETAPRDSTAPRPEEKAAAGATPAPGRRFRWKIGLGILGLGLVAQSIAGGLLAGDRTRLIMSVYYIWPATVFALLIWWTFASGLRWRIRLAGVGIVLLAAGTFLLLFEFKGFWGDMVPRFAWRWGSADPSGAIETAGTGGADRPAAGISDPQRRFEITEADWPGFRGPRRDGILRGQRIPTDWEKDPPQQLWEHPVGAGWSSFAVVEGRAFTQEQRGDEETVVCYHVETGEEIWSHTDEERLSEVSRLGSSLGGDGPRATPTVTDSRVYALGATGVLNCLDALSGREVWSRNIYEDADAETVTYGTAGSPLVFQDKIVVNPGGEQGRGVIAYNRFTGEVLWAEGDRSAGYAAPRLEALAGQRQILIFGGDGLAGHDPDTGRELWFQEWSNSEGINAAQPIVVDGSRVFISTGYGRGSALVGVRRDGENWSAGLAGWKTNRRFRLKFNGAVLHDGHIYGLDEGVLACLDVSTGKVVWKRGRYGYGQILLLAEQDLLLVLSERGRVALVRAAPESFQEVADFQAIEGKTWNHPVVHRGRLLVRNAEQAACYRVESSRGDPPRNEISAGRSPAPQR